MPDTFLVHTADRVAVATLNRPEVRNALDSTLRRALAAGMAELDADDGVDAIVLTGADPAFCAGLDLRELGSGARRPPGMVDEEAGLRRPFGPMATPVIGAINGPAVTGGLELALLCHFRIASERARFADTHARVGIQPGWGLTVTLPEAVGLGRARQMSATGNYVDAATALRWGLVNEVVPHDELLPRCLALAADISSNDGASVRRILQTYAEGAGDTPAWQVEADVARAWGRSGAGSAEEVERRRAAIMARGRSQHQGG